MNFQNLADNLGLDEAEYRELVDLFMTTATIEFEILNAAIAAQDVDIVIRSAHSIKGASGNLGFTDLYNTATLIENNARSGNLDDLTPPVKTMQTQFEAIADFIGR